MLCQQKEQKYLTEDNGGNEENPVGQIRSLRLWRRVNDPHFPEIGIVDMRPLSDAMKKPEEYSPSEAFAQEQEEKEKDAELEKFRADVAAGSAAAREAAMDRPPPAMVRAYSVVFGREPEGWPPG